MKKKAILGFMTGAALVAATTGSYAAWDKLSVTNAYLITIAKPVTVTSTLSGADEFSVSNNEDSRALESAPVYTVEMPISVEPSNHEVKLTPSASLSGDITNNNPTIEVYKGAEKIDLTKPIDAGDYTIKAAFTMPDDAPTSLDDVTATITATLVPATN